MREIILRTCDGKFIQFDEQAFLIAEQKYGSTFVISRSDKYANGALSLLTRIIDLQSEQELSIMTWGKRRGGIFSQYSHSYTIGEWSVLQMSYTGVNRATRLKI